MNDKSLKIQTAETFPKEIGARIVAWQKQCVDVAADQIKLTNEARTIGLLVKEWSHEQLTLGFYQQHKAALPKQITFDMLRSFASIANKLPQAVTNLAEVRKLWQPQFQCAGMLPIPERQVQSASHVTPFMELVNCVGRLRQMIVQWTRDDPISDWDDERRTNVKEQLKPIVEFYEKL